MTFSEVQTLLEWARTHGVACIKTHAGGVDVAFFPEKGQPDVIPSSPDPRHRLDLDLFGVSLDREP